MSGITPAANASLSISARLAVVVFPCLVCWWLYNTATEAAILAPLVFLPTLCMFGAWACANHAKPERRGQLETMVWIYFSVSIFGTTLLGLAQLLTYLIAVSLVMGPHAPEYWTEFLRGTVDGMTVEERERRAELAGTWKNWLLIVLFSFVMAGGFEEILKYLPVAYARYLEQKHKWKRESAYIDFALAGSLGMATVECIGFLHDTYAGGSHGLLAPIVTLVQRQIAGTTGHMTASMLTSLRATRSDFYGPVHSWLWIISPSMILHGIAIMTVFISCTLDGHVGWVHPTELISIAGMYGNFFCVVCVVTVLAYREHKILKSLGLHSK